MSGAAASVARLRLPGHRELRLSPSPSELARARCFADDAAKRFGFDAHERHEFTLAAHEAVANAIEHGHPCADGTIHVCVTEGPDTLTFGVRDAGRFMNVAQPAEALPERGRGLLLMSGLVDELALTRIDDHTDVRLLKRRRVDCGEAADGD